jgi:hypothetical protein
LYPTYSLDSASQFDAIVYGEKHPNTVNYLRNQFNHYSDTLSEAGQNFLSRGASIFETFNNSESMRFVRNVVKEVLGNTNIETTVILSIFELNKLQSANLNMQRWIMANPAVRTLYHEQGCDGYSTTYIDNEPGRVGDNHYDWRRVNDGIMHIGEDNWTINQYFDELKEGDRDLSVEEKSDILFTWSHLDFLMALGKEDPTSPEGSML